MNCKEVEERDILEAYLLDRLSEPEREQFERHYFGCDLCFSQLKTGLTLRENLSGQPHPGRQAVRPSRRVWFWIPAFAVVALVFAMAIRWYSGQDHRATQPSASRPKTDAEKPAYERPALDEATLEKLAQTNPPPYSAVVLRGAEDEAQEEFRKAMQHYVRGDFRDAIPGLQSAVKVRPQTASFNFYLGACYLMTKQPDSAIEFFQKALSLDSSTYAGQAHFYLAKAYLQQRDVSRAEDELQKAVLGGGTLSSEAAEILRQLRK